MKAVVDTGLDAMARSLVRRGRYQIGTFAIFGVGG